MNLRKRLLVKYNNFIYLLKYIIELNESIGKEEYRVWSSGLPSWGYLTFYKDISGFALRDNQLIRAQASSAPPSFSDKAKGVDDR